jgi:hypothetical protein
MKRDLAIRALDMALGYANITQDSSLGGTADFKNVAVGLGFQMSF